MAIMIPDAIRASTVSAAERRLFTRLKRELPDSCRVLHSLDLKNHPIKLVGEADFVMIAPLGVFVLEVKGGGVSCQDGTWIFTDRHGGSTRKPEGPFAQVRGAMFALREAAEKRVDLKGLLWGYGVVMPDEIFTTSGPEIAQEILLDRREYERPLAGYLERLQRYWASHYAARHRPVHLPTDEAIRRLSQCLRPDARSSLKVGHFLASLEDEQAQLTDEQARILQRLDVNPRTEIRGAAGTGKTMLALDHARRLAAQGQRVLYVCFNRLLGRHVSQATRMADTDIVADSIHRWFDSVIRDADMGHRLPAESDPQLFNEVYPALFEEAAVLSDLQPFDSIVIDEGQDLLRARFLDALDLALKGGLARGSWHMFLDPNQAIFSGAVEPGTLERLADYGRAQYTLTVNCRNTTEIAIQSSIVSDIDVPREGTSEGGVVNVRFVPAEHGGAVVALDSAVRTALDAGLKEQDIIVLSARTLHESGLAESRPAGRALRDITAYAEAGDRSVAKARSVDFATIHAFKGLERRAVIAFGLDALEDNAMRLLHYCGLTRARTWLAVLVNEAQRPAYERLAADFGRRLSQSTDPF